MADMAVTDEISVGVVGCGRCAVFGHLPALGNLRNLFRVSAVCDVEKSRRDRGAQDFPDVQHYRRLEDMAADPEFAAAQKQRHFARFVKVVAVAESREDVERVPGGSCGKGLGPFSHHFVYERQQAVFDVADGYRAAQITAVRLQFDELPGPCDSRNVPGQLHLEYAAVRCDRLVFSHRQYDVLHWGPPFSRDITSLLWIS